MNPSLEKLLVLAVAALPLSGIAADAAPAVAPRAETRCGWFSNPTPNNASLTDRNGEWTIAIQGEFEAKGDWPEFKKKSLKAPRRQDD
jgi:hypothetical protein